MADPSSCIAIKPLLKSSSELSVNLKPLVSSILLVIMSRDPLVVGNVVGDVLDPFVRSASLRVVYNNKELTNGSELKPSAVANEPRIEIHGRDMRTLYTLLKLLRKCNMRTPYLLVTDIPETTNATYGNEIVAYENPRPTAGIHRFVFVLFRQSARQTIYAPGWRQNFSTRDFAAVYNLGEPVAAMFFNCQRENGCGGRRYQAVSGWM
ncbi:protein FLOWERING LOCUS T-like [Canna indica]|uniref:Protein FLOWERING LOCUS T-like n=1 Tax=Canna indica TaxID=4628 RepID=A0AAQ3K5I8_9LILI|nr:protein FLOWERING LOCUS T-like [Canna indica]